MPGYTKNEFEKFISNEKTVFTKHLKEIEPLLPLSYDAGAVMELLKRYYPFELQELYERKKGYDKRDATLMTAANRKPRFNMPAPEQLILSLLYAKELLSNEFIEKRAENFDFTRQKIAQRKLDTTVLAKVKKRQEKIRKATERTQRVEPFFLDALMGQYERKNTSQKDRMYIMKELEKYECPKVVNFFQKRSQSEYNFQLREEAVHHLQEFGHYAVLRKQKYMRIPTHNKKRRQYYREYGKQRYTISFNPNELEYRIDNGKEQKLKRFDYFISHSSADAEFVQKLINYLNSNKKLVYCDWCNDRDYLKRNLVGEATKKVIETELAKSDAVIFVDSDNSRNSLWVKYELNYADELGKPIFTILKADTISSIYQMQKLTDLWYADTDWRNLRLFDASTNKSG